MVAKLVDSAVKPLPMCEGSADVRLPRRTRQVMAAVHRRLSGGSFSLMIEAELGRLTSSTDMVDLKSTCFDLFASASACDKGWMRSYRRILSSLVEHLLLF